MGTFDAKPWYKENKQRTFELESPSWARYLKFKFLDHYGDEHYCAYTQVSVFGSTTLQGYQEMQMEKAVEENRKWEQNMQIEEISKKIFFLWTPDHGDMLLLKK